MSEWYEAKLEDIEVDIKEEDFNVYVKSDDCGNIYTTISFSIVKHMYGKILDLGILK